MWINMLEFCKAMREHREGAGADSFILRCNYCIMFDQTITWPERWMEVDTEQTSTAPFGL
jgi:hypothetical protein